MKKLKFIVLCVLFFLLIKQTPGDLTIIYEWDFGDDSPHCYLPECSHEYTQPDRYTWTLTVTRNGEVCEKTGTICINQYKWDFGDGSPLSYEPNPIHLYEIPGIHTWTLTYKTCDGDICQKTGIIEVSPSTAVLTLTSPNGGENWQIGSIYDITWSSSGMSEEVTIDLYKGGIFDSNIDTASVSSGSFSWDIPLDLPPGNDYQVRIHKGTVEDYSNDDFSLIAKTPFLSTPDFNRDAQADVTWRYYNQGGYNAVWLIGTTNNNGESLYPKESMNEIMNYKKGGKIVNEKVWKTLEDPNITDGFEGVTNWNKKVSLVPGEVMVSSVSDPRDDPQAVELPAVDDVDWILCGTGDFNFDGKIDIVWSHIGDGRNCVWFMDGVTFIGYEAFPDSANLDWILGGVGDFNLDGKPDLLWRNEVDGRNAVWYMDGTTLLSIGIMTAGANLDWKLCGTGDFNNDGKVDLVWRNVIDGRNAVWYMDGAELSSVGWLIPVEDQAWELQGTGDFNSDGKSDLIWRHMSEGRNCIWFLDGVTYTGADCLTTVTDTTWIIEN